MRVKIAAFFLVLMAGSCSPGQELRLPYANYGPLSQDLSPLNNSNIQKAVRIWISSSTSIDRAITITKDSILGESVQVIRYGHLVKASKSKPFYRKDVISPRSSVSKLWETLDTFRSDEYRDQNASELVVHGSISRYIVEYKEGPFYKQFYFETTGYFPNENVQDKYLSLEQFFYREFLAQN